MAISKVVFGNDILIDITDTTATSSDVQKGKFFYDSSGVKVEGNIPSKSSSDVTISGPTVSIPSGYYNSDVSKAISTVAMAIPTIEFNTTTGAIQAKSTQAAGYVAAGSTTVTSSLGIITGTTITPTESIQTIGGNAYVNGTLKVGAISSDYVGSAIAQRSSADLSYSNGQFTVPSGYYENEGLKNIPVGGNIPAPSLSLNRSNGLITSSATVASAWYSASSSSRTLQLDTQAAITIAPTESLQIAVASNKYTLGDITVAAIPSDYIGSAIDSVSVVQGVTTIDGSTVNRGVATWSTGVISSGSISAATFANSSTAQTEYVDISETTEAPILISGDYLYINQGYTDNLKISLAKLAPDSASADLSSDKILSGYAAYNNDGELIAGNIPSKSSSDVTVLGPTVSVPSGYYSTNIDKTVQSGSVFISDRTLDMNPTISLDSSTGIITAEIDGYRYISPQVFAGYVTSGTSGKISVAGTETSQLSTQSAITITPTESSQIAVASGKYTLGDVSVAAISSDYVGSAIATHDSADLSISVNVVTVPSGYYPSDAVATISKGRVTVSGGGTVTPTISVSSGGIVTAINSSALFMSPHVVQAGYISQSNGYSGQVPISGSKTYQLSVAMGTTIIPTTTTQTAVATNKYTIGAIQVQGDADLIPANIVEGVSIFGVTGTAPTAIYTPMTEQEIWIAAASGWNVNAVMNSTDIAAAVSNGWR